MCSQSERNIQELESISTKNFYGNNCVRKRHYYSDPGTKNFLNASIGRNEFKSTNECKRRNFFSPYASPRPEKYFLKSKNFFDSKFNLNHIKKSCLITSEDLAPLINKSSTSTDLLNKSNRIQFRQKLSSKSSNDENKLTNANEIDDDLSDALKLNKMTHDSKYFKTNVKSHHLFDSNGSLEHLDSSEIETSKIEKEPADSVIDLQSNETIESLDFENMGQKNHSLENEIAISTLNGQIDEIEFNPDAPCPLKNLGNTCYMNSIVQAIFSISYLMTDLLNSYEKIEDSFEKDSLLMTKALLSLYKKYASQKTTSKEQVLQSGLDFMDNSLTSLKNCVGIKSAQFKSSFQQDAAEFFELMMNEIEEEFDRVKDISKDYNPIQKNFQIDLDSKLKCLKCSAVINLPKMKTNALYLTITSDVTSLQHSILNYFKEEKYEHKCEETSCGGNEKLRTMTVSKIPRILFLQLGRYSKGGEKMLEIVEVPLFVDIPVLKHLNPPSPMAGSGLKLSDNYESLLWFRSLRDVSNQHYFNKQSDKKIASSTFNKSSGSLLCKTFPIKMAEEDLKLCSSYALYQLVAVVCHIGNSLTGGHYIAYIFNEDKGDWYECDDTLISKSSLEKVQESSKTSGYCFFYSFKNVHEVR